MNINDDISMPQVERANEKQSFIRNILNKIGGSVYGRKGTKKFDKNKLFL